MARSDTLDAPPIMEDLDLVLTGSLDEDGPSCDEIEISSTASNTDPIGCASKETTLDTTEPSDVVEPAEPTSLIDRWRAGDESAARELFEIYVERLLALARRRLSQRLASRVDPEDIVQSVFRTFFGRVRAGKFEFADQDDLCKLLVRITVHKTLQQVAFHKAAKRDPNQEECQGDDSQDRLVELFDREPTPEDEVAFIDQLETFLSRLRPQERQILEMRMQGYSNEDIADQLGIYDRKIRRIVERIRGLAQQEGWTI